MKKCYKGLQINTQKNTNLNMNEQMLQRFANIQKNTNPNVNDQMLQRFATMEEKVLVSSVLRKFNLR